MDLLFLFEWLDGSWLANISKAYGGVFALVQTVHLSSLTLLGGMVITTDLRLLNVLMRDVPVEVVVQNTRRWMSVALCFAVLSGVYQASAVAIKLYYNSFFWAKMTAFLMALGFTYIVKLPMLNSNPETLNAWTCRLLAVASLVLWFSVAATGRWIGFS